MMKRIIILSAVVMSSMLMAAQTDLKTVLQHASEYSSREFVYKLQECQRAFPQQPLTYYWLANLNYDMQEKEHPLADYRERSKMLYDARVYYGNCRAYLSNGKVSAAIYPLAVEGDGRLNEEQMSAWLTTRIDTVAELQKNLTELYGSYCTMVNRYDTCVQMFSDFMAKYGRLKDAQLMLDSTDEAVLSTLREVAMHVPEDVSDFEKKMKRFPIEGYHPTFTFQPVSMYRMEGLTSTDFLQNDIRLWDYVGWTDAFFTAQKRITHIRKDMQREQERFMACYETKANIKENTMLLNRINQYDEHSLMAEFMHYEYLAAAALAQERRIAKDSISQDDWLGCLQMAERHGRMIEQCRIYEEKLQQELPAHDAYLQARYTEFISTNFADKWPMAALQEVHTVWENSVARLNAWLLSQESMPREVQIDEERMAIITEEGLIFEAK